MEYIEFIFRLVSIAVTPLVVIGMSRKAKTIMSNIGTRIIAFFVYMGISYILTNLLPFLGIGIPDWKSFLVVWIIIGISIQVAGIVKDYMQEAVG